MLRRLILPGFLAIAAYFAVFGGEYSALDVHRIRGETEAAREALAELGDVTMALAHRVEALEGDPRTLEALARENFGMIREGEVLYRFADAEEAEEEEGDGEGP
jgi:cell division protein FtsB